MQKVILLTSIMYSGDFYLAGETLELKDSDAKKWTAQGIARLQAVESEQTQVPQPEQGEKNANLQ